MYKIVDDKVVKIDSLEIISEITSDIILSETESIKTIMLDLSNKLDELNKELSIVLELENEIKNK